jgi:hypothetical protein
MNATRAFENWCSRDIAPDWHFSLVTDAIVRVSRMFLAERGSRCCYGVCDVVDGGGRSDPLRNGGLSADYVPILGTALGVLVFLLAGLLTRA